MDKKNKGVGTVLISSLTEQQLALFLNIVCDNYDFSQLTDILHRADEDMAQTVLQILNHATAEQSPPASGLRVSNEKTIQYWNSLWDRWHDKAEELGDEEGKYVFQENRWETPYFDGSLLASDLDEIGIEMLDIIEEVYESIGDPDLYIDALDYISDCISSYPEWMGAEYGDGCPLNENVTLCFLRWLWLFVLEEPEPEKMLVIKVANMDNRPKNITLDNHTVISFFAELDDDVATSIHEYFNSSECKVDLSNTYSCWYQINHLYEKRFDKGAYMATCKKHLSDNWRYGRILIDKALQQNKYKEADSLLTQTFASYLHLEKDETWNPEESLLPDIANYYPNDGRREEIFGLLQTWAEVAQHLKDPPRTAAIAMQSVTSKTPDDWDAVIGTYKEFTSTEMKAVTSKLFRQWQNTVMKKSLQHNMARQFSESSTWVHQLINASLNSTTAKDTFGGQFNTWITTLIKQKELFLREWPLLALLTSDLPESCGIKEKYPALHKRTSLVQGDDAIAHSRRKALEKVFTKTILSTVLKVWHNHLSLLLPDPANANKSNYMEHAGIMATLYEVNKTQYNKLLSQWRIKHKRRKNLWRDMRNFHLLV